MNKKRIFLDLDGVVFNWTKAALSLAGMSYDDLTTEHKEYSIKNFYLDELFPTVDFNGLVDKAGADFWANLELYPWGEMVVSLCCYYSLVHDIEFSFFTSPGRWKDAPKGKLVSLERHFRGLPVLFGREKWLAASKDSFLIDDKGSNIEKFKGYGGGGFQFPSEFLIERHGVDWLEEKLNNALINWLDITNGTKE